MTIIRFYSLNERYGEFGNFWYAPFIDSSGLRWETTEAYYQAHKFVHVPSYFHLIRFADTPRKAFLLGRMDVGNREVGDEKVYEGAPYTVNSEILRHAHFRMREDWDFVKLSIMYEALIYKFTQHPRLQEMLINTGDAELQEDSPVDYYWGIGADGSGKNWLGHLLMTLRTELQKMQDM